MELQELIDRKIEDFFEEDLSLFDLVAFCSSPLPNPEEIKGRIDDFIYEFNNNEQVKYIILKIIDYLNIQEFTEKDTNAYTSFKPESVLRFKKNIQNIIDFLILKLEKIGNHVGAEMFSSEEFIELKNELSKISSVIFEFQNNQAAANEVLFNSVEEIKEQLFKDAEKGKIFGKEFVKQQLAGKLMDMTMKGGATAFISYLPEHLSKIQKFLGDII